MELQELFDLQRDFDRRHGWGVDSVPIEHRMEVLEHQIIGLVGEVGELANLVKKARLRIGRKTTVSRAFEDISPDVKEELTDVLIYLIRLFQLMDAEIEKCYQQKVYENATRFKEYETDDQM